MLTFGPVVEQKHVLSVRYFPFREQTPSSSQARGNYGLRPREVAASRSGQFTALPDYMITFLWLPAD